MIKRDTDFLQSQSGKELQQPFRRTGVLITFFLSFRITDF